MSDTKQTITLLTDFGGGMGYVGQMKGVILSINPDARIVDLCHDIAPQSISQAAFILEQSLPYFPKGSIHLAVVDPGVGCERLPLLLATEDAFFIGPDNGLLGFLETSGRSYRAFEISNKEFRLENPSSTFHGRDIFAPAAAHLSLGHPPEKFGKPLGRIQVLKPIGCRLEGETLVGEVLAVDSFGNLITTIDQEGFKTFLAKQAAENSDLTVSCKGQCMPLLSTFAEAPEGELLAYIGSSGRLEIAVNLGNAQKLLKADMGVGVTVTGHGKQQ